MHFKVNFRGLALHTKSVHETLIIINMFKAFKNRFAYDSLWSASGECVKNPILEAKSYSLNIKQQEI